MGNLKLNDQRAKSAIILIWIVLAIEIVMLISYYFQYDLLQSARNGVRISFETASRNDTSQRIIAIVYLITYIISGITFIHWFRRAYFNLHVKMNHLSYSEGWAAGSWFVPFVNLFRPYRIMKELYKATDTLLKTTSETYTHRISTGLLGWWWALWIICAIIDQFVFRYSMIARSIDELTFSTVAQMIGLILGITLALITVYVIKDYSDVEPLIFNLKDERNENTTNQNIVIRGINY
jgi:hypothetical protein